MPVPGGRQDLGAWWPRVSRRLVRGHVREQPAERLNRISLAGESQDRLGITEPSPPPALVLEQATGQVHGRRPALVTQGRQRQGVDGGIGDGPGSPNHIRGHRIHRMVGLTRACVRGDDLALFEEGVELQ